MTGSVQQPAYIMATRIPGEEELYYANLNTDRITDDWTLISNPFLTHIIIVVYLAFVLKLGPAFMKHRAPFKIRKTLLVYNSVQVIFSVFLTVKLTHLYYTRPLIPMNCSSDNRDFNRQVLTGYWLYFIAKATELLDTVFFILRKKYSQVTFLHVYHHTIMMYGSYFYINYYPTEHTHFLGTLNSVVHIIMYTYYTISGMGPRYAKYIWWKKYVTKIQLTQFCLMLTHLCLTYLLSNCPPPIGLTIFIFANIMGFLLLFLNFYIKSYLESKKKIK